MKLNEQDKKEFRTKIEEMVALVPEGKRIKLDVDLLDDLIFFKGKNKEGTIIKVPIWTGEFLRKIDLSEVSFDNVLFQCPDNSIYDDSIEEVMDAENVSRFINIGDDGYICYRIPFVNNSGIIDFSYTNINIDFSKIYDPCIERCNFEGLDLSNSNGECIKSVVESNFANTHIKINFNQEGFYALTADFSNNDFSYAEIAAILYMDRPFNNEQRPMLSNVNFSNTGLKISYIETQIPSIYYDALREWDKLSELYNSGSIDHEECELQKNIYYEIICKYHDDNLYKFLLREQIKNGYLNGCYLNGKLINYENPNVNKEQILKEYEEYKQRLLRELEEQVIRR